MCGLLLNKSRSLEMRLKRKLSRVHFADVSQAIKKTVKEELGGKYLLITVWT